MPRQDLEALFLANLASIEKILAALARRNGLAADHAEEFAAWAKLRLIENDYGILAKFRAESSLTTYLTVVLAMLFREYRVQEWGRWRPSAAAKRNGPLGIKLEVLIYRDGLPLAVAGQMLRTSSATTMSDSELAAIIATFPRRSQFRPTQNDEPLTRIEGPDRADQGVAVEEAAAVQSAITKTLNQALEGLPDDDRLIVRLRFFEGMTVAQIARALDLPQKPLYRRLNDLLGALRDKLLRAGFSRDDLRDLSDDQP